MVNAALPNFWVPVSVAECVVIRDKKNILIKKFDHYSHFFSP
jgi:hypothetical protein